MSGGSDRTFDPQGEARKVLQGAIADFGEKVLSNATILEGICEDRLPESPREASLISSAARADVPGMLQQQVGGVGPDAAVRLTAATLADSRSLDPAACVWVVGEFARCLGYQVSEGISPSAPGGAAPAPAAVVTPAPAGPAPAGPPPGAPTAPPTGGPAFPAAAAAGPFPGQTAPAGPYPPGPGAYPAGPGPAPAGTGPAGGMPTPFPPGPKKGAGAPLKVLAIGAAVIVLYFVVAGVGHLPPFSKPAPAPAPTPSPHHSRFKPTPADLTLSALVPSSFKSGGHCVYRTTIGFGAAAEVSCTNVPAIPAGFVNYYLFSGSTGLDDAYSEDLSKFAQTTEGSGNCGSFTAFSPTCETIYGPGHTSEGHMVEYLFDSNPDITFTVDQHLLMIDMQGTDGNSLLNWWKEIPSPWLAPGS